MKRSLPILIVIGILVGVLLFSGVGSAPAPLPPDNNSSENEITGGEQKSNTSSGTDNEYPENPVNKTIKDFENTGNISWDSMTDDGRGEVRGILEEMAQEQELRGPERGNYIFQLDEIFTNSLGEDGDNSRFGAINSIIRDNFKAKGDTGYARGTSPDISFDMPSIVDQKLKALKDAALDAFNYLFKEIYSRTLGTPVPQNDGWHQVLGTPTNEPFKTLHQKLLVEKLHPVMNRLLGLGILFLGASFTVNPFMSRFRIWDLLTKFVAGLMFYAFAWTGVTLLHGVVGGITDFIVPNPDSITQSAGTLLAMGSSVPIAAALGGAATGYGSLFGVGLILGIRHFLLTIVFPYIFGPLLLILYISPWQRLRSYTSMVLWQYINILTMVVPIAIVLKAAVTVQWAFGDTVGFIFTMIGSLLFLLAYPIGSSYFFFKASGSLAAAARSGASSASSRIKSATESVRRGTDSASDTTATGGQSTGDQAQTMVATETGQSGTAASSTSSSTTAADIRDAYDAKDGGNTMSAAEMKEYIEQNPKTTTLKEKLGS